MRNQLFLPYADKELYGNNWQYLLIVSPDRHVADRTWEVKEDFFEAFKQRIAVDTLPHITVAAFNAKEEWQEKLITIIQQACSRQKSFRVDLKDFKGFEPHAIYIEVLNHKPFLQLAENLGVINDCLLANGCSSARLVDRPHLTIARRLPRKIYHKAMEQYSLRRFEASFPANELVLLRRRHRNDTYKRVAVSVFCLQTVF